MSEELFDLLSAYADGELPEHKRREIELRLQTDPEAREILTAIEAGQSRLRQAYLGTFHSDPPARLMNILARPTTPKRRVPALFNWSSLSLIAACAAVGVLAGSMAAARQPTEAPDGVLLASAGGLMASPELARFLNTAPSGELGQAGGTDNVVVLTFEAGNGELCRQFQSGALMAVGCRTSTGDWSILATAATAPITADTYTLASMNTSSAIEAALASLEVSSVFDSEQEAEALSSGRKK